MGDTGTKAGKSRKGKLLRWLLLGVVVVVLLLVALGPTIAGPVARPIVERAVNGKIRGHAAIDSLGLSWFGSQRASLTLDDPAGGRVADVSVRAETGLLGLALGSRDLGVVRVSGSATIVRDADGTTNLQRAIEMQSPAPEPAPSPTGEPARLPGSLGAVVVLDGLTVTYQDAALAEQTGGTIGAVRLGALTGSLDFAVGKPVGVTVKGPIATGRDAASVAESGSLDLTAELTGLTDSSGTLTPGEAGGDFSLTLRAPALDLRAKAGLADGVLATSGETSVSVSVQELARIVPRVGEALAAQPGVKLDRLPTVTVGVDRFRAPVGGDLRAVSASVVLTTSEIGGTVDLPTGETTATRPFAIEPLSLRVEAPTLAETVTLRGGTRATIGGESAGVLSVDLAVGGLLDETGKPRGGAPGSVSGGVRVKGFSTPILQPFVAAVGAALPAGLRLDLPQDLGPTVDLALGAESHTDGSGAYDIDLSLDSQQAEVGAALVVDGQRVASRGEGVRASVRRLAPVIDRVSAAYGVRVNRGADLTVRAADFAVDMSKLKGEGGPDLRGVRASVEMTLAEASGKVQLAGDDTLRDFRLDSLTLGISTDDLGGDVRVTGNGSGNLNGKPFASMKTDMTLSNLLGEGGAPRTGSLPTLRGEVRVNALALDTVDRVFAGALGASGLVLARDVGPSAEVLVLAASNPQAGPDATDIDLTVNSANLTVTAPLTAMPDRLRTREPIVIVDRAAGESLSRLLAGKGPVGVRPGAAARLTLGGLDVPLGAGGVRPDKVALNLTATVTDLVADVALAGPDGAAGPAQRVDAKRLVATVSASPGAAPTVGVEGQLVHADQPFRVSLAAALHDLFREAPADAADPMSVLALDRVRPEVTLELRDVPATLARVLPPGMVQVGGKPVDTALVARDTLGRTFGASVTTRPNPDVAGATRYTVGLDGEHARVDLAGGFARDRVRVDRGEVELGVTARVASHLAEVLAPDAPVTPGLTEPAGVLVALNKPFEMYLTESFAPDLTRLAGDMDARVVLDAALAAITLPAGEGKSADGAPAKPMVIPPVRVRGLRVDVSAPESVLGPEGGEARATLAGALLQADGSTLANLSGTAGGTLKNGKPEGETPVTLTLSDVAGAWIDRLLDKPSLVAGSLGDQFGLTLEAFPGRWQSRTSPEPAVSLSIKSPRLTSDKPIAFAINQQAVYLHKSFEATWVMGPRWANLYFLGSAPGGPAPAFAFTEQTPVKLELRRLGLAMTEGAGLFKPGVFNLDMLATVPKLPAVLSDGRAMLVGDLSLRAGRGPTPDQLSFVLTVPRMKLGDTPEVRPAKNQITGRVSSYADAQGNLTPDAAVLNVSGGLAPIPTDVIDAFARQNGLLRDALGPTVDVEIEARDLSKRGGTLAARATTPLARAAVSGSMGDGVFVVDPAASTIEISQVTPALTARFQKALPVVATLEKSKNDEPAVVKFESPLELPIDGNMDRLNGKVTIDIGTARFGTADLFQRVLAIAQQKTAGEVGRRLPPLKLTMDKGLISYEPYQLPFGEFKIESQGFINLGSAARPIGADKPLPAGQLQVLTFIPSGAFAAEAVPGLANLPLPLVGNLARLPVRTNGLIAKPSSNIAVDLVGQEAINELNPGKLIDNLLKKDQ